MILRPPGRSTRSRDQAHAERRGDAIQSSPAGRAGLMKHKHGFKTEAEASVAVGRNWSTKSDSVFGVTVLGRRVFVLGGAAALLASPAAAGPLYDDRLLNPCLAAALPERLARHEVVRAAWEGIDPAQVWDVHVHLVGTGDSGEGPWLSPRAWSVFHPTTLARRLVLTNAACARFYGTLVRTATPLLTHAGEEAAVDAAAAQELGNPLRLRRALDHGVRVIVAHCGTLGKGIDLDKGAHGPRVSNFALFTRL